MQKSSLRPQCSTPLLTGVLVLCVVFLLCASVTAHNEKCFSESNLLQSKVNQEEEIPFHSSLDVAENVIRDYVTIRVLRTSTAVDRILDLQEKSTSREQDPMPTDVSVPNDGTKLSVAKRKLFSQLRSRLLNMNCIVSHSSYRLVLSMMRWEGDTFPVELHVQTSGGTLSLKSAAFPNVATNIEVHMDILEMSLIESLTVLFGAPELLQTIHVRLLLAPILPMIPSLKPSPSLTMYEVFRIIHESNATELRRGGESELVKLLTSVGWDPLHIFMVSVHESDVVMDAAQLAALPHSSTQSRFGSAAVTSLQFTTVLSLPKDANVTLIPSLPSQLETVNVVGFSFAAAAKCTASNGACSVTVCIRANATCKTHPKLLDRSCKYFPSEMFQAATSTTAHDPRSATEAESQSTSTSRSSQTTTEIPIQYEVLVPVSQRRPLGAVEVLLLLDSGSRLQSLYIRPISFRIFTEPVQGTFPYLVGAGGEVPTSSNAPPWSIAVLVLFLLSSLIGTTGLGLFLWQRYEHQKQTLQSSPSCYDSAYYGASGSRDRPDHYYTPVAPFSHDWNTAEPISNVALAPPTKENHDSANSNLNLLFEEFTDEEGSDDDTWAQTKKAKKKKVNKKTTKKPKSVTTTAKSKTQKKAPETENSKSKPNESEPHTRAPSGSPKLVMPIATEKRESLLQVDLDDEIEDVEDIDC